MASAYRRMVLPQSRPVLTEALNTNAGENVGKPSLRIEVVELGSPDQRVNDHGAQRPAPTQRVRLADLAEAQAGDPGAASASSIEHCASEVSWDHSLHWRPRVSRHSLTRVPDRFPYPPGHTRSLEQEILSFLTAGYRVLVGWARTV